MKPRGFTLLEMLVVLALIGVMAGIALPNFSRFLESFSIKNQWAAVERELADVPYQVFISGANFQLDSGSAATRLTTLPEGWRIEAASPIVYRFSGWCEGGRLSILSASGERRNYQLVAPACSPTVIAG
ncbi:MAG: prepilin-type N-terminal cleavage/methylation domain-containing protein [Aeromicrobium sp.]|nr:prepilin-type N-terminal cleavage/methylation domain-containing protein [Burkholderiales bacterium]